MSDVRITQRLMTERSLSAMQAGLGRLAKTQEQLTTGRVINRPSDSPTGTNTAMRLREQVTNEAQFSRNIQDGLAWLGRTDSTMSGMITAVQRVRDLTLQGLSTGSIGPQARQALATEVAQIREGLVAQANTTHLGRPLFGGTTGAPAAYQPDPTVVPQTEPPTYTFVGEPGTEVSRTIAAGVDPVRVNVTGTEAFGDLFKIVGDIVTNLQGAPGSAGLETSLKELDGALNGMVTTLADVGSRYARLESAMQTSKDIELHLQASLSAVENVDMARAMVDLQMQEVAYQAALGATARVLQPSLIDFLR